MRRTGLSALLLAVMLLPSNALASGSIPRLDGTFATHFVVLQAHNVQPGPGATGSRTWIFEHQNGRLYLLEGLANGGFARVRLHRSSGIYTGVGKLRAACIDNRSATGVDTSQYTITVTHSAVRSGRLTATAITAYLRGTYTGCNQSGAFDLRRYRGHLTS